MEAWEVRAMTGCGVTSYGDRMSMAQALLVIQRLDLGHAWGDAVRSSLYDMATDLRWRIRDAGKGRYAEDMVGSNYGWDPRRGEFRDNYLPMDCVVADASISAITGLGASDVEGYRLTFADNPLFRLTYDTTDRMIRASCATMEKVVELDGPEARQLYDCIELVHRAMLERGRERWTSTRARDAGI